MNSRLVREWMKKQNVKPVELAVKLGISSSTMTKLLAGRSPLRPTVMLLAHIMKVPLKELLHDQEDTK